MKITHKMQEVAVDILNDLEILLLTKAKTVALEKIKTIIDFSRDKYNLCEDPFTGLTCTAREYAENSLEYQKQAMIEKEEIRNQERQKVIAELEEFENEHRLRARKISEEYPTDNEEQKARLYVLSSGRFDILESLNQKLKEMKGEKDDKDKNN